jgi:transcriptional regulator with XRE-family HTH domain
MFGDELKRLRKQRKMSQIDLADRLNVSQSTITSWENGTRRPDIEMLPVIADLFDRYMIIFLTCIRLHHGAR